MKEAITPGEQFERTVNAAVDTAFDNRVHPAIIYLVLASLSKRVLQFVENNAQAAEQAKQMTEEMLKNKPTN